MLEEMHEKDTKKGNRNKVREKIMLICKYIQYFTSIVVNEENLIYFLNRYI